MEDAPEAASMAAQASEAAQQELKLEAATQAAPKDLSPEAA